MTVLGTRPEIIRMACVVDTIDKHCEQYLIHSGQNDGALRDPFLDDLKIRQLDSMIVLKDDLTSAERFSTMFTQLDATMEQVKPDRLLVLGDTYSVLAATLAASNRRIPIIHMEAGNRCYDDRVPEERNRRLVDHMSTIHLPFTHRSKENLIREGIRREHIFVVGNPINEVMIRFKQNIKQAVQPYQLNLHPGNYLMVTMHRAENVDNEKRLLAFMDSLGKVGTEFDKPVVVSLHPRTRSKLAAAIGGEHLLPIFFDKRNIRAHEPFRYFDFLSLEREAFCTITDSGTVQEETCILGLPAVTIRDTTERPETVESGSNILAGSDSELLVNAVRIVTQRRFKIVPPPEYLEENVSSTVMNIALGYWPEFAV